MQQVDCIVIGGGAAGLMCAATAAQRGKKVVVLDHANKVGKKILMSGGGRCNFTNYYVEPANYLSANPHFCKSALSRFTQYDFLEWVYKHNIAFHEKTLGQLFCDNKAKDILNMLLAECAEAGVTIKTLCEIHSVAKTEGEQALFTLQTSQGEMQTTALVIATGGLSIPTMGATGFGYDLARQFGLEVKELSASLVPLVFQGKLKELFSSLAGLSLPVEVSVKGPDAKEQSFKEALLFTHKGLSGPAILQISNYWQPRQDIELNFLPEHNIEDLLAQWREEGAQNSLKNLLARLLPKRFVELWLEFHPELAEASNKTLKQLSTVEEQALTRLLHHWQTQPSGTEGYKTAEVTRGGVSTDEVSSKTFESKKVPGLYFIGEVLDVTGWLGGFNFQWAWSSAWCAAQYV